MRILRWVLGIVVVLLVLAGITIGPELYKASSEDPEVWDSDIAELVDRAGSAPPDPVLFVGSSSIRLWSDLAADMAPLPVLPMGFGGAKIHDVLHHLDDLVLERPARAVVIFVGTNDLTSFFGSHSKEPEDVFATYERIIQRIRAARPEVPIYFIAIKPTTTGAESWPKASEVNRLVESHAAQDPMLRFLDANAGVTLADGSADPDLLVWDGIHLNRDGYLAWGKPIRERLLRDLQ